MQLGRPRCSLRTMSGPAPARRGAVRAVTTPLLLLALAACGSDSALGPNVNVGQGSVRASGAVSTSGSGVALFQTASSGTTQIFQIAIAPTTQGAGTTWALQIARSAERPPVGTYSLSELSASSTDPTANLYITNGSTSEMFNSTAGELVITSSSSSLVRGTFSFTAASVNDATRHITVEGAFAAQCAPGMTCQ